VLRLHRPIPALSPICRVPDLRPAAEALEGKFPEAASLLYRRLVESVLDRGSSKQYPYGERFPILHASLYASADARID
jgi:hypothetical protein